MPWIYSDVYLSSFEWLSSPDPLVSLRLDSNCVCMCVCAHVCTCVRVCKKEREKLYCGEMSQG